MFRPTRASILLVFVLLTGLHGLGCTKVEPRPIETTKKAAQSDEPKEVTLPPESALAIAANLDFTIELYKQLAIENQGHNLFLSPYSLSGALVIAMEGAEGETAEQMGRVLCLPKELLRKEASADLPPWNMDGMHAGVAALNRHFTPTPVPQKTRDLIAIYRKNLEVANEQVLKLRRMGKKEEARAAYEQASKFAEELNNVLRTQEECEVRVSNGLWSDKAFPLAPSYLVSIRKFYNEDQAFVVDFQHQPEAARKQINGWIEAQTDRRIRDFMPANSVDEMTRLILTNAVYFRGEWKEPFAESSTEDEPFNALDGVIVDVLMMYQGAKRDVRYAAFNADGTHFVTPTEIPARQAPDPTSAYPDGHGFLMLELPYQGGELSMVVIVPKTTVGTDEVEKQFTAANLRLWIEKLEPRLVHVSLPKFSLETEYAMKPTLAALGMTRAFEPIGTEHPAQFQRMCVSNNPAQQLFINDVRHKAFVEVNEKGTEAAAVAAVSMAVGEAAPEGDTEVPFTPTFRADRPFLFLIRDLKTGIVLFVGRVTHPDE